MVYPEGSIESIWNHKPLRTAPKRCGWLLASKLKDLGPGRHSGPTYVTSGESFSTVAPATCTIKVRRCSTNTAWCYDTGRCRLMTAGPKVKAHQNMRKRCRGRLSPRRHSPGVQPLRQASPAGNPRTAGRRRASRRRARLYFLAEPPSSCSSGTATAAGLPPSTAGRWRPLRSGKQ